MEDHKLYKFKGFGACLLNFLRELNSSLATVICLCSVHEYNEKQHVYYVTIGM